MNNRDKHFLSKGKYLVVMVGVLLGGCSSFSTEYTRPAMPVSNQLSAQAGAHAPGLSSQLAMAVPWQTFIKDERLKAVITLALENNRSLRETLADVEAARATYRIQRSDLYPNIDVSVSGTRARSTSGVTSSSYAAEVGLSSYEIDLFGKNQRLTDAEMETYLASEDTFRATKITLIGEIANAWLTLAADQNLLSLAKETADNAQQTLTITQKRMELGVDSRIDVASAKTTYYAAQSDIASYTTQVNQDINALRLLVGSDVDQSVLATMLPDSDELVTDIPAGLGSDILLTRPDVLAAEHDLKAAHADIDAARAAFFPSISLTAAGGLGSLSLSDLFSSGATKIWSLAPSISLPIFNGGENEANLDYAKAQQQKYLAAYEYAIQSAFSEVADALARRATIQQQIDAEEALVAASKQSYELSLARYKKGVDSFQTALEAQRTYYSAAQSLILTRQSDLENRITLYRVMGGGIAQNNAVDPATDTARSDTNT
ncbi:efflux transporter outer membrane subunit [Alteromonas sp. C1M14]|uniref:efflux transporter outer membrane subunit n=1 Tax=Alteromonas sp. C1M14 TaxID=2841567 RepID=UPI001C08BA56|nr:efflux transporter outer membrane subunit [Alteromonas sp. C1M14]MBU2979600.1 efflux transporter outer membrane subunit [Alteromonas sp. C1M14]